MTATHLQWQFLKKGNVGHVRPLGDLIRHDFASDCPCSPFMRPVGRLDGTFAHLYVHRSADRREREEAAR